ncbi:spore coat protein [Clostridium hydrogenum]|uniref:spore coat protein n=1 Tax=Clostridium hydrogenum TaxID=2855764 RepID=UPI001F2698E7|nr:spore coat protein [Clostridium hydrogenum]
MNISLSTKERFLLQDAKSHETLCVEKYTNYENQASDTQLKDICYNHAKQEQEHLNSVNELLSGRIPNLSNSQSSSNSSTNQQQNVQSQNNAGMGSTNDKDICSDLLMTEKYVSSTYDTTIFEFRDTNARNVLNHIQKEEQEHGDAIFKYMESKGMYTVK